MQWHKTWFQRDSKRRLNARLIAYVKWSIEINGRTTEFVYMYNSSSTSFRVIQRQIEVNQIIIIAKGCKMIDQIILRQKSS